jgi:hypothetical protein
MGEKIKPLTASETKKLDSIVEASFDEQDATLTATERRIFAITAIFEMLGGLAPVEAIYNRIRVPFVDKSIAMEEKRNPTINYEKSSKKASPYGGARSAAQAKWSRYVKDIPAVCADLVPKGAKFVIPERSQSATTAKNDTPEKKAQRELSRVQTDARKSRQARAIAERKAINDRVALLTKACYTAGNADNIKLYNSLLKKLQSIFKMMQTKTKGLENDSPEKAA